MGDDKKGRVEETRQEGKVELFKEQVWFQLKRGRHQSIECLLENVEEGGPRRPQKIKVGNFFTMSHLTRRVRGGVLDDTVETYPSPRTHQTEWRTPEH